VAALLGLLALLAILGGCQTAGGVAAPVSPAPKGNVPYLLDVGDQIEVKLFYHPELNEIALVRTDGKITLQLVGEVVAVATTTQTLAGVLKDRYVAAGLRDPAVAVMLRKSAGQRVYVGGEVGTPKMVPYEGRLTLSQAIFEAGGLKRTAQPSGIVLLRNDGQGGALFLTVNFNEVTSVGRDIELQPYDVVIAPKSFIAHVNDIVEQYITKVIPVALSAGFSYVLGPAIVP
jgi:protein involved in polysaccharide export with SLBB domain